MLTAEAGRNSDQTVAIELGNGRPCKIAVCFTVLFANDRLCCIVDEVFVLRLFNTKVVEVSFAGSAAPAEVERRGECIAHINNNAIGVTFFQYNVGFFVFVNNIELVALCINSGYKFCAVCKLELNFVVCSTGSVGDVLNINYKGNVAVLIGCVVPNKRALIDGSGARFFNVVIAVSKGQRRNGIRYTLEGSVGGLIRNHTRYSFIRIGGGVPFGGDHFGSGFFESGFFGVCAGVGYNFKSGNLIQTRLLATGGHSRVNRTDFCLEHNSVAKEDGTFSIACQITACNSDVKTVANGHSCKAVGVYLVVEGELYIVVFAAVLAFFIGHTNFDNFFNGSQKALAANGASISCAHNVAVGCGNLNFLGNTANARLGALTCYAGRGSYYGDFFTVSMGVLFNDDVLYNVEETCFLSGGSGGRVYTTDLRLKGNGIVKSKSTFICTREVTAVNTENQILASAKSGSCKAIGICIGVQNESYIVVFFGEKVFTQSTGVFMVRLLESQTNLNSFFNGKVEVLVTNGALVGFIAYIVSR